MKIGEYVVKQPDRRTYSEQIKKYTVLYMVTGKESCC